MQITVQQLKNSGVVGIMGSRAGNPPKGLLSLAEAQDMLTQHGRLTVHSDGIKIFLSDDHIYGNGVLPKRFVPMTGGQRDMKVTDYLETWHKDKPVIQSLDELVEYVNTNY